MESLRAEHEALMQFLYLAPVGLVQAGIDGEIVMINPISAQLLMPLSPDGCLTNLFTALEGVAPGLRLQCAQYPQPNGMVFEGLHIHLRAEERRGVPQILSFTLLKLDEARIMAVIQDVTAEVRRERQLRQSDAWLNAILTRISDYALAAIDREGRLCDWNDSIARVTGFGEHIVGSPYSIFYPPDAMTGEHLLDRLREADANGWSMDEGLRLRADGSQFWCSALIAPLPDREAFGDDPSAPAYCLILRDISDKRAATEKRRQAAFCDHLTSLANRRAFFEAAELELERAAHTPRSLALIVFDADHFKQVNDRYGHPAGDRVLCDLANVLRDTFRAVDTVARLGGEEFAVLLPSTGIDQALASAERLRLAVSTRLVAADGAEIAYTVSAGVAVLDATAEGNIDLLIKRADEALYIAKAQGRNRVASWTPELTHHADTPQRSRHAG
ncbi:sensor domain-containing diguanylate cyclase [Massilia sp. Mn16-1_5]|uniref:sensor domain-containing diguanylate cyclase n=1 Tax=Massilia sp. Mn16-1_5 TaxID=2079199 RepID=UPI001E34177C|nr:sensor domain-containing diguanylate cyclase [Massilia sp. Mn16-1_5]